MVLSKALLASQSILCVGGEEKGPHKAGKLISLKHTGKLSEVRSTGFYILVDIMSPEIKSYPCGVNNDID